MTRPTPSHLEPTYTAPEHLVEAVSAVGWRLDYVRPEIAGGTLRWAARVVGPGEPMRHVGTEATVTLDELARYLLEAHGALTADSLTTRQIVDLDGEVNQALVDGGLTADLAIQGELCRAALSATEPGRRVARWRLATVLNRRARAAVEPEVTAENIRDSQIREWEAAVLASGSPEEKRAAVSLATLALAPRASIQRAEARARCVALINAMRRGGHP